MPRLEIERTLLGFPSQQLSIERKDIDLEEEELRHEFTNFGSFRILRFGQDAALVPQKMFPDVRVFDQTGKDWTGVPMIPLVFDVSSVRLENTFLKQGLTIKLVRDKNL